MSFDMMRSPSTTLLVLSFAYAVIFVLLVWNVVRIFRQNGILIGHLRDVFNFLTKFRIWTLNHRKLYTASVASAIVLSLLGIVYWAERGHYYVYDVEPLFTNVPEYFVWITVLIANGFGQGELPKSFLGVVIAGGMPFFILGSLFAIVHYTSERGHEIILEKLAKGDIPSYRVVVFNYQPKYENFVHTLLEDTDCFVILFSKKNHIQEAEGLKDNFAETSGKRFRITTRELTYSDEILFENIDLLEASEVYILSDMTSETEFKNSQLLMRINQEVKRDERIQHGLQTPPQTVWEVGDRKREQIANKLDSDEFLDNFYPLHFYRDSSDFILANLGRTTSGLDEYFGFNGHDERLEWFDGETLENYRFTKSDVTERDWEAILHSRGRSADGETDRGEPTPGREPTRRTPVESIEAEPERAKRPDGGRSVTFYGLVTDIAGYEVPVGPDTATFGEAAPTVHRSLHVVNDSEVETKPETTLDIDPSNEIIIVNVNENVKHLLSRLESEFESAADAPTFTVYYSGDVSFVETDISVNYVRYESKADLVDQLFSSRRDDAGRLCEGDALLLFLDHSASEPHIESIKLLDLLDDNLRDRTTVDHDEVFLCVESKQGKYGQVYDHMSVDKRIDTFQTQEFFLNNLVLLRNSDAVRALEEDGTLASRDAFDWAVKTAFRLRHFVVQPAHGATLRRKEGESAADRPHTAFSPGTRSVDSSARPFAGFEIDSEDLVRGKPRLKMINAPDSSPSAAGRYLLFLPRV